MKYFIISHIILLILFSCNNTNNSIKNKTKFYANGNIKELKQYLNKKDTNKYVIIRYLSNGEIQSIISYKNKMKDGKSVLFFDNGLIKNITYYYKNKKIDWSYDYNKNGKLIKEKEYVLVADSSVLNQFYFYSDSKVMGNSHFYEVYSKNDTVYLNDFFKFKLLFYSSNRFDSMRLIIGDFDEFYNKIGSKFDTLTTTHSKNFDGFRIDNIKILPKKIGYNYALGIIDLFQHKDSNILISQRHYFHTHFFVKDTI